MRLTSVTSWDIAHVPWCSTGGLGIVEGLRKPRIHPHRRWMRRVGPDAAIRSAWLALHGGRVMELCVLHVLLLQLCFCGNSCGGRVLSIQNGREVHDTTQRSAE